MKVTLNRREFLATTSTALAAPGAAFEDAVPIDFRYAPLMGQTAFCFPDDPHKSLAGEHGDLRLGFTRGGLENFALVAEFSVRGMEAGRPVSQWLEAPGVPIVHTRLERPEAFLELTTFATNRPDEGRVDNVILQVRPRGAHEVRAVPVLTLRTRRRVKAGRNGDAGVVSYEGDGAALLAASSVTLSAPSDTSSSWTLSGPTGIATGDRPFQVLFRFPQQGQDFEKIKAGLAALGDLLAEAREYWRNWRAFGASVAWNLPGRYGEFLTACARNIQQAREVRNGRLTFQVGPTVYRGLWVVDGNFILEAARYLGYDAEAQQGLEATWAFQEADGGIFAGAGREHWKDTGIAMFTLVRQAELGQDWSYFRKMQPALLRAVEFLRKLCEKAKSEGSACGRYGLLPRGMGDGGLGGLRSEFTNTIWVLAGIKAVLDAAAQLKLSGFDGVRRFHDELRANCLRAARQEMRRHPAGFDYLPMLMKEDKDWNAPDPWNRPRPQVGQWALSHAIYPGLVFDPQDPVVQGHVRLMQECTQEDIPAETGWLPHEGVWNYNAAFVAHVYLWAGLAGWARNCFHGFLNHATPLYCWREEQPIRGSLVAGYVGDMPHNWASAECVLFLRHMLALEDGPSLRLLAGVGAPDLSAGLPFQLAASPTRFGRITLKLEPDGRGWRLDFAREAGPAPSRLLLPAGLDGRLREFECKGAGFRREADAILVEPGARAWSAAWRRV
jgi:hypothetical protein